MSRDMPSHEPGHYSGRFYSGLCPDGHCQTKLVFRAYESSIECTNCGQRHELEKLQDVKEVTDLYVMLHNMLKNVLLETSGNKRGVEAVKVMGLSNYHCKILSPLLTRYGMDKKTGKARLLTQLGQAEIFDCGVLGDRCFLIEREHTEVVGYGRDISGSGSYLFDTLNTVRVYNDNQERLLPVHADGDGHCLVHAVSRALVGRELFWHPLRTNLQSHLVANLDKYKALFRDFIDQTEWSDIIAECSPDFEPEDGELLGLRNIHIFGLANVLRRPIILIDSLSGMQSPGDYSATFLPALAERSSCMGRSSELNKPLCIAWSSSGRNHYIPLVGIKNCPLPRLPRSLVPKAWGLPQDLLGVYIEFDQNDFCVIGGDKCLQDSYILRLASAMEDVFMSEYSVHPSLVADVHHYIFKRTGVVGVKVKEVLELTQKSVREQRLYICLVCGAIVEKKFVPENLKPGGALYDLAVQRHGALRGDRTYNFPLQGVRCSYNVTTDELEPEDKETVIEKCSWCSRYMISAQIRRVSGDGSIQYQNGDKTKTQSTGGQCKCRFKHFWDGLEYDNQPLFAWHAYSNRFNTLQSAPRSQMAEVGNPTDQEARTLMDQIMFCQKIPIRVVLEWAGKSIKEKVHWFKNESDPRLNSNVYTVASNLVQKHFPGVFGSERLVQKVVDQILEQTKEPEKAQPNVPQEESRNSLKGDTPEKIILSGFGTVHKEELTLSEAERLVRQKIRDNAPLQQRRRSAERGLIGESSKKLGGTGSKMLPSTAPPSPSRFPSKSNSEQANASHEKLVRQSSSKMVRVVTSDGRQLRVVLDENMSHFAFLSKLEQQLNVQSSSIKRILYGFPPRELVSSSDTLDAHLPFEAGDKVSVEIVAEEIDYDEQDTSSNLPTLSSTLQSLQKETDFLQKLQDLQNSNVDNLDTAVAALLVTATLTGHDVWSYVQSLPQLFSAGGLLYRKIKRDMGLADGKHCRLDILPEKVFCYSSAHDRLELCLDTVGHFAVEPGVEERLADGAGTATSSDHHRSPTGSSATSSPAADDAILAGSSGVVISRNRQKITSQIPFRGKGYSLATSSKQKDGAQQQQESEQDEARLAQGAFHLNEDCRGSSRKPDELMETDEGGSQQVSESFSLPTAMVRRGPGYSVLNPEVTNQTNVQTERLRQLASQLGANLVPDSNLTGVDSTDDSPFA